MKSNLNFVNLDTLALHYRFGQWSQEDNRLCCQRQTCDIVEKRSFFVFMKRGNDSGSGNLKLNIIIIGEWESVTESSSKSTHCACQCFTIIIWCFWINIHAALMCMLHISYVCMLSSFHLHTVGYSNASYSMRSSYVCSVTVLWEPHIFK